MLYIELNSLAIGTFFTETLFAWGIMVVEFNLIMRRATYFIVRYHNFRNFSDVGIAS